MKTNNYFKHSLFVLLASSLITACTNADNKKNTGQAEKSVLSTTPANEQTKLAGTNSIPLPKCEKTFRIPQTDIQTMTAKYKTERLEITNKNLRTRFKNSASDPESAWFPLEEFECFLKTVKDEVAARNLSGDYKFTGLRVYFTVYPEVNRAGESDYLKSIPAEMRNRASFVIIPTYKDASGNNVDLNPEAIQNTNSGIQMRSAPDDIGYNHVGLCPPNCL
ncbi:MAG: hypothetical protein ABI315_09580 [Bacteroidia bacterium]